jgi:hypothetical protein
MLPVVFVLAGVVWRLFGGCLQSVGSLNVAGFPLVALSASPSHQPSPTAFGNTASLADSANSWLSRNVAYWGPALGVTCAFAVAGALYAVVKRRTATRKDRNADGMQYILPTVCLSVSDWK